MHFEHDGIGMPTSEPPPVVDRDDLELHEVSYSDQHDRYADLDDRHYGLEHHDDVDPSMQYNSDVVVLSDDNDFEEDDPIENVRPSGK